MSKTIFSRELRLLLCPQCGAPIEGSIGGGATTCRYCNAGLQLAPRDETRDVAIAAIEPQISEADRFQRLREQDGKPMMPPASLQHLLVNGGLSFELVPQALGEFQRARHEVVTGTASFGSVERLYFVTLMLYGALSRQKKEAEVRALLETARDLLTEPRHRQAIHGMLARNAARTGDREAAEGWLALCHKRPADLHMDTAFRVSRAYASTLAGDLQTVLKVLGTQIDDVPIADGQDELAGLLRANALERTGQVQQAAQQIAQLSQGEPGRDQLLAQIVQANPELQLCPQSFAMARAQAHAMQSNVVVTRGSLNIGLMLITIFGAIGLVLAADFIVWAVVPSEFVAIIHVVLILGSIGSSFAIIFLWIAKANAAKKRLLATGAPGRARVLAVNGTGVKINGQPMLEIRLQVTVPGRSPYVALHREVVSPGDRPRAVNGASVGVRVDPADPTLMAINWQEG